MYSKSNFYFSRLVGQRIIGPGNKPLGRLRDIAVDVGSPPPRLVAAICRSGGRDLALDFLACAIEGERKPRIVAREAKEIALPAVNLLFLRKHLMDKQIVDVDGRKLVRVNDLVIDSVAAGAFLVAVDVGLEGLFRRLGLERPVSFLYRLAKRPMPGKFILWKEVEAVDFPSMEIKLSTAYSKLATFHPSDLADILEDLDRKSQLALFSSLDEERAADVMEELEPEAQTSLLEGLSEEKAADVLEKMPADEVADIMDGLDKDKAERLLSEMESESSQEVRSLMEYPENTVGSLMSTDFVSFAEGITVEGALRELRRLKPEADTIYHLYVLDPDGKYRATVPLRDIVVSEPTVSLSAIMDETVEPLNDGDDVYSIAELLLKYKLHAVPVVGEGGAMVGTIVIEDVLEHVMSLRRRK
jgi:CBS domain-containing protein